ncbi:SDR family oxidoreductase [Sphingomonadaceae bacterium]|nr:SDR family oxidoreductase [Sphingomonadaceae bacterium]
MPAPAVLITGGAKRLGAAMARGFSAAGWRVVIHYRSSADEALALAEELPDCETIQCDLSDGDAAQSMVEDAARRFGDWRVLINNASIFLPDDVTGLDPETYNRAMQINAQSPIRMAQAFLNGPDRSRTPPEQGRCVINVTDQKLANPNPDFFSYTLSKQTLAGAIPPMAMAAAAQDRIYGLAPGAILPSHDQSEEETETSHRMNLLERKTGADEVADAALFLASGALASGQTLFVDSGQHLLDQPRDVIYLARDLASKGNPE